MISLLNYRAVIDTGMFQIFWSEKTWGSGDRPERLQLKVLSLTIILPSFKTPHTLLKSKLWATEGKAHQQIQLLL